MGSVSITKTSQLILYKERIVVYSKNCVENINMSVGKMQGF